MELNDLIVDKKHLLLSILFWTSIFLEYYYKMKKKEGEK